MILFHKDITFQKIKRWLWGMLVRMTQDSWLYPFLYKSYWHYRFFPCSQGGSKDLYYSARPNPGAGIGHQMANWIAGYWWAKQFGLKFAHIPFSTNEWDVFLGFGNGEITVSKLQSEGYLIRKLPLFREDRQDEIQLQRDIISSHSGMKIVFIAEQDQVYEDQYGVKLDLQEKFFLAPSRKNDSLIYEPGHYNIAIHVRRGDIVGDPDSPNMRKRYLSNQYFYNVLNQVLGQLKTEKAVHVFFFSQGTPDDFSEFKKFENLHWCFDMSAQQSFLHMVYADLLITSKSSFSYKPALLNQGIKVCPKDFWHGYPNAADWVLCDNEGNIITAMRGDHEN